MRSSLVFIAPLLFTGLVTLTLKAEPPSDTKLKTDFAAILLSQAKTGQFDVLESEYQDFKDQEHQLPPDGTPKIWIYFWAFEMAATSPDSSLEDYKASSASSNNGLPPSHIQSPPRSPTTLLCSGNASTYETTSYNNTWMSTTRRLTSSSESLLMTSLVPCKRIPTTNAWHS